MSDKDLFKDMIDDEKAYVPMTEKTPIEISGEAAESEAELEKIAPVEDSKVLKTRSMSKKALMTLVFIAVNVIAILLTIVMEFSGDKKPATSSEIFDRFAENWQWGVLAGSMLLSAILAESLLRFILLRTTLKRNLLLLSIKSTIVCKYYDNITPLGSGGQPFEVYFLRKKGIPIGIASGVPVTTYAIGRTAYVFIALLAIAIHGFGDTNIFIQVLCIIGLVINVAVPLSIFGFTVLPRFCTATARFVAKIAAKLHIVKNEETAFRSMVDSMTEYADCLRYFLQKSKINLFLGFLCSIGYFVALYSIPYFTIRLCGNHSVDWFETFALCAICYTTITLLPTPGGAGGAELSFRSIFQQFLSGGVLVWGMITWRIISYYSFILLGLIAIICQQIFKFTRAGRREEIRVARIKKKERQLKEKRRKSGLKPDPYMPITSTLPEENSESESKKPKEPELSGNGPKKPA